MLLEKDPTYQFCATTRSAASIRHQFSVKENIQISQFGTEFLRNINDYLSISGSDEKIEPQFKENGYLFLASDAGKDILNSNISLQKQCGADIAALNAEQVHEKFPWMYTSDISLGGLGVTGEGWFDPSILMNSFRNKARSQGVICVHGNAQKINCNKTGDLVESVTFLDVNGTEHTVDCGNVINASGAENARNFSLQIGRDIPVYAKKRCIFVFDSPDSGVQNCPLVVDPSGMYFRAEGKLFITGIQPEDDPNVKPDDFDVDYDLFDETIWPLLANRVPKFETLKVLNAWAGHYDHNLFDHNVIVGPDTKVKNFYFANGFSGHGLQQSPAIGRALSELIIHEKFITLDLS
eukprot:CAMPEP_0206173668 /NCGR_PEP_ID=MMETSP1474-20131121/49683_1 /ASSEMBLY_ACC=CAM_ASM_001110 /TAXON_ID=97495 /ORGANISM="Imantonia sp., Strain RCC918" /LENGTH=350 /DNA_ID=CAMNT_0053582689 /DNA_START=195 /DNA_END=1244 /DNA_ORIENTATION=+